MSPALGQPARLVGVTGEDRSPFDFKNYWIMTNLRPYLLRSDARFSEFIVLPPETRKYNADYQDFRGMKYSVQSETTHYTDS